MAVIDPKTGAIATTTYDPNKGSNPQNTAVTKPPAGGNQFITTKYGTKINVTGLNPAQQKAVLSMAQDKGAYGSKAAAYALELQKGIKGKPGAGTNPVGNTPAANTGKKAINYGVDKTTGRIDPNAAIKQAPEIFNTGDFQKELEATRDAQYNYLTKDYESQKSLDFESAKQELANRGIPFDPNPESLYGRTLKQLTSQWDSKYSDAKNQAILAGNEAVTGFTGANTNAFNAFMNSILGISGANTNVYGLDKSAQIKREEIAAAARRAAAGGSNNQESGPVIGGMPPGF